MQKTKQGFPEDMHPKQRKYAMIKAERDQLKERVEERTKHLREAMNQAEDEEIIEELIEKETEIEREMGLLQKNEELRGARYDMVEWMFRRLEATDEFQEFDSMDHRDIERLRKEWPKNSKVRNKVVDLAFKYNPNH